MDAGNTMDNERTMTIDTGTAVHVYPVAYFERLIRGAPVEPLPVDVLGVIVREWLTNNAPSGESR